MTDRRMPACMDFFSFLYFPHNVFFDKMNSLFCSLKLLRDCLRIVIVCCDATRPCLFLPEDHFVWEERSATEGMSSFLQCDGLS